MSDSSLVFVDTKVIVYALAEGGDRCTKRRGGTGRLAGSARISFWDALLFVFATRLGAEVLLTEDLNPGQRIGSVRIVSPF
jgi:predicted nucleic acid-binding protein